MFLHSLVHLQQNFNIGIVPHTDTHTHKQTNTHSQIHGHRLTTQRYTHKHRRTHKNADICRNIDISVTLTYIDTHSQFMGGGKKITTQ